jgi:hypothetical protein
VHAAVPHLAVRHAAVELAAAHLPMLRQGALPPASLGHAPLAHAPLAHGHAAHAHVRQSLAPHALHLLHALHALHGLAAEGQGVVPPEAPLSLALSSEALRSLGEAALLEAALLEVTLLEVALLEVALVEACLGPALDLGVASALGEGPLVVREGGGGEQRCGEARSEQGAKESHGVPPEGMSVVLLSVDVSSAAVVCADGCVWRRP